MQQLYGNLQTEFENVRSQVFLSFCLFSRLLICIFNSLLKLNGPSS